MKIFFKRISNEITEAINNNEMFSTSSYRGYSYESTDSLQSVNESILNHLFLPFHLSSSTYNDCLLKSEHENEYKILECMDEFLESLDAKNVLPIITILKNCIQNWSVIQNRKNCTIVNLQSTIQKLTPGDFLPLYFYFQNAAILIEIDEAHPDQPLISSWQVLLPTETITSSLEPHCSHFPVPTFRLPDQSQLLSRARCELLTEFMKTSIECAKARKSSYKFDETREVPVSHYVCQWWITQFEGIEIDHQANRSIQFTKKHRDQIRYQDSAFPFRRSGLWMTIKVVFHTILTKRLGNIGTIVYKLLITNFLTYFIYTRQTSMGSRISTELLIHCLRKIVRRLNKIENLLPSIVSNELNEWIQNVTEDIKQKIDHINPDPNWQKPYEQTEKKQHSSCVQLNPQQPEIYQHPCLKLKAHIDKQCSNTSSREFSYSYYSDWRRTNIATHEIEVDELPTFSSLINRDDDDAKGIALTRMEIWVQMCLEGWINRSSLSEKGLKCFEKLQSFYEDYQREALKFYYSDNKSTDPIGYSRFILTGLTVIHLMHKKLCEDKKFERLKLHAIKIPHLFDIFEFLVLPSRDEMTRARDLYDYFRQFDEKLYPDLLHNIESTNAFGVYFADQSPEMNQALQEIQEQVERDKEEKIEEVNKAKEKYEQLMRKADELKCECEELKLKSEIWLQNRKCDRCTLMKRADELKCECEELKLKPEIWLRNQQCDRCIFMKRADELKCECEELKLKSEFWLRNRKCNRCILINEANAIEVSIYECPIPSERKSALAVIFELQMPGEIRCFRDILWQFINRPNPNPSNNMYEWLSASPHKTKLGRYYNGSHNCKVKLLSSTKSISQSHYAVPRPVASTPLEEFLYENGLEVQISPTKVTELQNECLTLTPELTDLNYKDLQFSINSTQCVQNRVIAELSKCSLRLKSAQFIEFGSFRSGHRLQWWNLLTILELDSLSMEEESVAILLTHALLQYGPVTADRQALISHWCPESHQQLLEDHFLDELIARLDFQLQDCESNWQNELMLVIITVIIMRMFTVCNSTRKDQMTELVLKCCHVGEKWIRLISESIQNLSSSDSDKANTLRDKIVIIGVACLLTFSMYTDRYNSSVLTNESVISLLTIATTIHDNTILSKKIKNSSVFMRNIIRSIERTLVTMHPMINELLEKTSYETLNEFCAKHWAVIRSRGKMDGKWKKRNKDIYDSWYDGEYQSNKVSIDILRGRFFVNSETIGFLPDRITSDQLFIRVFGHHIFEVQAAESEDKYITKHGYHADGKVHYEFSHDYYQRGLRVYERHTQTQEKFELIPPNCFETELPDILVSNYSHWYNEKKKIVEFRPVRFQDANFLSDTHYELSLKNGIIKTRNTENSQCLVYRSSSFFKNLFERYFTRMDDESYVYMLRDNDTIHIHLSRLGIAFKYNLHNNLIASREYSDMYIDENQWFGTLTGLKSGLLLSPIAITNQTSRHYLCRKLIVPFGNVQVTKQSDNDHQVVTVDRKSTSTSNLYQYFVFILNDRLRTLQPTDSPTGWLYLALLHAMTSHPLPDQYTGMTGMERAFQLLHSAGCWSDQPYDAVSRHILLQIATISPKVNYYPEHLSCMHKIEWNQNSLPYSMQHFGYYLIAKKLIETSEKWNFMHPSSTSNDEIQKLFESKKYNEKLLAKLYWDYQDSYNLTARLSAEMETEICCASSTKPYQPVWENYSYSTNHSSLRLVDHLYGSGNVDLKESSKLKCFPLSQWLKKDYELKNIWIGLYQFIEQLKTSEAEDQKDDIERFEILLDFLHYISGKCSSPTLYIQMLKSILKTPTVTLRSIEYPSFIQYQHIEDISFQDHRINLGNLGYLKRSIALQEIKDCFVKNCTYRNNNLPRINQVENHIRQINMLLHTWRENGKLRSFVEDIQNHLRYITMIPFDIKIPVNPQQFSFESFENHYQTRLHSTNIFIDQKLHKSAERKFLNPHSDYFIKLTESIRIKTERKEFPEQIFPSTDPQANPLSDIAKHFRQHLTESWKQFNMTEEYQKKYPSVEEINKFLDSFRQESKQFWDELVKSITTKNELLFKMGLMLRILPTTLISVFQQMWLNKRESNVSLTTEQRTLLGGIMVNWIVEQQLERALHFANQEKWEDFEKEISNTPHANWTPSEHVPWLILQLEMNITIREIQVEVARHMIQPKTMQNTVMQLNMGEGKTSVILPMLALSLCSSSSSLVRIIVLKSLFPMNYQSLRYKLGGLLNRRVLPFACRRDMNFDNTQADKICNRLKQGLINYDVILTSPEDILSFDLLTIDKCRRNEFDVGRSMLSIQRWIKTVVRDVLDESDEILHVKYQLIYSIGRQQQVDGGLERWKIVQTVLNLVKKHATDMAQQYTNDIFYKASDRQSNFPELRLLNHGPFSELCQRIANDWLDQKSYYRTDQQLILSFILNPNSSVDHLIDRFPHNIMQSFLIMRGLLSSEVLFVVLKKRYRVNFGVNQNAKFNRLMAVPFLAKDVAAENTEFGHPDVAIALTQISYYYSGLNDSQIMKCFDRLSQYESDPEIIYDEWISLEEQNHAIASIKEWKKINLKDSQQRTQQLFPTLRKNMLVVDYFLNHFVFLQEAKQFPHKLVSSAWDLSSSLRTKIITGFSGTNDTQLLLPVHIRQCDLLELQKTDAIVLNNLLQPQNDHYQYLSVGTNSDEILKLIVKNKLPIQVILDVGAVFVHGTNRQIAVKWLDLSDKSKIDYAVYFESDSIFVCDRQYQHHAFLTSPASERLDRCVFYMDEIHTRGTDFKFPNEYRAAVTLGNGLTKDRLVQACMRMRKLGKHHWLSFWSSNEVHQQIQKLKNKTENINERTFLTDILRWVYENTQQATWDGLHHWASQSLSFQRKVTAFRTIDWNNHQALFTNPMMDTLARECLEAEVIELKTMYGAPKTFQTVSEIYSARYKHSSICLSPEIHEAVSKRLSDYGGSKTLLSQLLDEEQQRELEREQEVEEERQQKRPPPAVPCKPELHNEIKKLCDMQGPPISLSKLTSIFHPISNAFLGTTFYYECQPDCWRKNIWITDEFKSVIQTRGESLDNFLRPARWIVVYRNQHIIFVSPLEANYLMGQLHFLYRKLPSNEPLNTTLRLLLPRTKRDQSIIVNTSTLTVPPSISPDYGAIPFTIPTEWLIELFIFNGTIYFETEHQQKTYCQRLGVCPKPRTDIEEDAFNQDWIAIDGFVGNPDHRRLLQFHQCHFHSNPLAFIRKLVENRNNIHAPLTSHVGSIIINAFKRPLE